MLLWSLLSFLLACAYFGLIYYYLKGWLKTPNQLTKFNIEPTQSVSIILPIRNEEILLEQCIASLLNQSDRIEYEILIFNDFSTDNTLNILKKVKDKRVKIINLSDILDKSFASVPNKKRAITTGVEMSKHDLICTVDGDCIYPENWLFSMIQFYEKNNAKLITAPVTFDTDNSFWESFLLMDLASLMGVTSGSVAQNRPVMANGANLMFEKEIFNAVNGYEGNEHIPSGDDVYLMQKVHQNFPKSIAFLKNSDAIATTLPPKTFTQFINQRIRWTSKSAQMVDKKITVVLVLNYLFYLVSFLNLFVLPFMDIRFLATGIIVLVIKIIVDSIFFGNILAFFKKRQLLKYLLPMEIVHIVYITIMGVLALFGSYKWKGRQV